ncbi:MAG: hypothetical protein B7Z26_06235 [Asticcacaulis sp. 32-58-5]|nr:MAG: hypothetical protein B7Z26_06235 [Asticcacaulis sp. 32-58-5]
MVWNTTPNWTLKGGVSQGFKTPRLEQIAPGITGFTGQGTRPTIGTPTLKPETSTSTEFAVFYDNRRDFRANVTVFHNKFEDKIASGDPLENCSFAISPDRPGCVDYGNWPLVDTFGQSVNVDEAETHGVEGAFRYLIGDGWSLTGNYTKDDPTSNVSSVDATIEAFERVGLMRTLAEPNLTTVSGESAKFLAGGEFPVPTGQDNQGRISVEFKPFGVGLGFTPVVLSSGRIALKLSTEVSELSANGSISLTDTLNIPAISVRRVETSVEMASGSSLMIAGLLQSEYRQAVDALPGMTTLPVIGSLFRSRDFLNRETELVVIVTPYIVAPTRPDALQSPADNLQIAHDLSSTFMGNMNKVIKDRGGQPPQGNGASGRGYQAPVGYVIE